MKIEEFIKENSRLDIKEYLLNDTGIIYFLCDFSGEIIYVGKTLVGIDTRVNSHSKRFSIKSIHYIKCSKDKVTEIEQKFIAETNPKYNIRNNHKCGVNAKLLIAYRLAGLRACELAKQAGIENTRFCRIVNCKLRAKPEEKRALSKILKIPQKDLF